MFDGIYSVNSDWQAIGRARTLPESQAGYVSRNKSNPTPFAKTNVVNLSKNENNRAIENHQLDKPIQENKPEIHSPKGQSKADNQKEYILKGKINGAYAVTMNLTIKDGRVTGTYYYDKYHREMKIEGTISNNNNMRLFEYENGKRTGEYNGIFSGVRFIGKFTNYASSKTMPFNLMTQ